VADWGEGMDRQVIENRLTRLFSSDKEGDRTKIGQFGIGLISVFAFAPDIVCIDTGRRGESFRVVFRPDYTYTCSVLTEPVEGTSVRVFKAMTHAEFVEIEPRVRRALSRYCGHVEAALRYQGELFSTPIGSSSLPCAVQVMARFTTRAGATVGSPASDATVLVGYTEGNGVSTGTFCNRGLTLLIRESELPGISYLVDSPELASTQGRDSIIADEHYGHLMSLVHRLASGPLVEQLSQTLDQSLREQRPPAEIVACQARLCSLPRASLPPSCAHRVVACSPQNDLYTLASCEEAARHHALYVASCTSPLSVAVGQSAAGGVVLQDWQHPLIAALLRGEPPRLERAFVLPLRLPAPPVPLQAEDEPTRARAEALCTATAALLTAAKLPVASVQSGHLDYPGSGAAMLPAVAQALPFSVTRLAESLPQHQSADGPPVTWVINIDHATVQALLRLAEHECELAAYHLTKLCLLGGTALTPELDSCLLTLAMELRCHSQNNTR
jgi:hypothetical protein